MTDARIYQFSVPGRGQPKERPRLGKGGRVYTPSKTRRYEEAVAWCALSEGLRLRQGDRVHVEVEFWLCPVTGDVDNRVKAVLDGLQRACPAWDDRDVVSVTARQVACERRDDESTMVTVEVLR